LYAAGKEGLSSASPLVVAEAILRLHDSIEIFQIAVLNTIGAKHASTTDFWQKVKEKKGIDLPFQNEYKAFSGVRNSFKHDAVLGDVAEMRAVSTFILSFFNHVSEHVLGIDFSKVSLADVVENLEVREQIKHGELAIASGDYATAVSSVAKAFAVLIGERYAELPPYLISCLSLFRHEKVRSGDIVSKIEKDLRHQTVTGLTELLKRLQEQIDELREIVDMLVWGMDLQRYKRFKYLTPIVNRASSGVMDLIPVHSLSVSEEDAHFCLEFVLDTALNIQRKKFAVPDPQSG
jgi:hypothetical protein